MIKINYNSNISKEVEKKTGFNKNTTYLNGDKLDIINIILMNKFNLKIEQGFKDKLLCKTYIINIIKP